MARVFRPLQPRPPPNGTLLELAVATNRPRAQDEHQERRKRQLEIVLMLRNPAILHRPSSPETTLSSEFVYVLEGLNFKEGWFSLIPSRIGRNDSVDMASKAIICANKYVGSKTAASYRACFTSYARAIEALQSTLKNERRRSSDEALLTVALLAIFETVLGLARAAMYHHMSGLKTMLSSRDSSKPMSEVTRSILHWHWIGTFQIPLALGEPSQFDDPQWLDVEPAGQAALPEPIIRLRKLANWLFIKLPRLIAMTRSLRNEMDAKTMSTAVCLAQDHLAIVEETAENELLHKVSVRKTTIPEGKAIALFSFHFPNVQTFEALVYYWQTRMMLQRLCVKLVAMAPDHEEKFGIAAIKASNVRMATNILMSWEFAVNLGRIGRWALPMGSVALWGVLNETTEYRGMPSSEARGHINRLFDYLFPRKFPDFIKVKILDEAADLIVGGPLQGFLIDVFKTGLDQVVQKNTGP